MLDENDTPGSRRVPRPQASAPAPVSERRVYRAGDTEADDPRARRDQARSRREASPVLDAGRPLKRTPILAVVVFMAIAVVIILAGVASRDGGMQGSQGETGTFKLLPITTTTTS
jgi:hypothetical protein